MSDVDCSNPEARWRDLPLCRSYLLVRFQSISLPFHGPTSELAVHWALGVHAEASSEVIGVWRVPALDVPISKELFEELRTRGLEKVHLLAGIDQSVTGPAMQTSYWSWSAQAEHLGSSVALSPRLRRAIRYGEEATQRLDRSLRRAVAGRGGFLNGVAAASFVAESLTRAERALHAAAAVPRVSLRVHTRRLPPIPLMAAARV